MSAVDHELLAAKLAQLAGTPGLDRLAARIRDGDDRELFRINPYAFAEREGMDPREAIELFLRATSVGITRVEWALVCRGCGEYAVAHAGLCDLDATFHCGACARERVTNLDEQVEVGFTIAPAIRQVRYARPEALELDDYFFTYRFSPNIVVRGEGTRLVDYLRGRARLMVRLEPGARATVELELAAGWVVGSPRAMIVVEGERTEELRELELVYDGDQFLPRPTIAPGRVRIAVRNASAEPVPALLYDTPIVTYFEYLPLLTGQRLLNTADFRRHLRTEVVKPGSAIPTRDNTLLFSDVVGSTQMYERIGDAAAFELVSAHFEALARVITRYSGAIVKTIGDAVMASFSRPIDAVRAALEMNAALGQLEERVRVKIGIHRGPCLVVNVRDHVDYFGQTVNIAARVQCAARAGELCLSEAAAGDPAVREALAGRGAQVREQIALRGVAEPYPIVRVAL